MRHFSIFVWGAAVVLLQCSLAAGQTEIEREQATLRGLSDFTVVVDVEGPQFIEEQRELSVRLIRADVERQLLEARIPVRAGVEQFPYEHYLYIHVNILDAGEELYPFAIEMGLHQPVSLARDSAIQSIARTWHGSAVGYISGHISGGLREAAGKLLSDFVKDYHLAN